MSKHWLVDGFNVIRQDPELIEVERRNFYGAQAILVERLNAWAREQHDRVTVVFDGKGGTSLGRHREMKDRVEVIFSRQGETADEVIEDLVREDPGVRSGMVVVTADRALSDACRRLGVVTLPPKQLLLHARPPSDRSPSAEAMHGKREEKSWSGNTRKTGNPRRLPKSKRRMRGLW